MLQLVKDYSLLKHHIVPLLHNILIFIVRNQDTLLMILLGFERLLF
jgi:hypothetical protein